ncbi:ribosome hibernation-promoting factor, HPF/YfiA family [Thiolinea disciformis]|uniref:ribosome hibernation-promoting factor, HPF/YfiA family n=1 Tax=Thiolinea disciformis TaxID=125614 RepID=UPI0003724E4E|nr:ribosome-associated translation inhibitor RaiA [Thiolinea disciformis]
MQLEITGHNLEVTTALHNYVREKFERIKRHFDQVINVHVILEVENKTRHKAEASINVSGSQIFANDTQENMYAAVDGLMDKLDRQVLKHKAKLKDHHRDAALRRETQQLMAEMD